MCAVKVPSWHHGTAIVLQSSMMSCAMAAMAATLTASCCQIRELHGTGQGQGIDSFKGCMPLNMGQHVRALTIDEVSL